MSITVQEFEESVLEWAIVELRKNHKENCEYWTKEADRLEAEPDSRGCGRSTAQRIADLHHRAARTFEEPDSSDNIVWNELSETLSRRDNKRAELSVGVATLVDEFGGEGDGDKYWFVTKVTSPDGTHQFFRRNGWYASYDGGYYDGPTEEVEAVEVVVTKWRSK